MPSDTDLRVFDQVQQQVERSQDEGAQAMRMERRGEQFLDEAARVLDLDAVVEHQQQHAQRHAHRHVQVGGRQHAVVVEGVAMVRAQAGQAPDRRHQVDGQQVQRVHQDDPEEHGEGERSDEEAALGIVDDALGLVVDHVDDHFHEGLEAARNAGGRAAGGAPQEEDDDQARQAGPEQRVVVDDVKLSNCSLFSPVLFRCTRWC